MLIALGWSFGSLIVLALLLLVRDVIGLLTYFVSPQNGRELLRNRRLNAALGIISVGLSLLGVWQAIRVPDVKNIEVTVPHLPPQMDGLRLVQLTDLHASRLLQAPWMQAVVEKPMPCNRI